MPVDILSATTSVGNSDPVIVNEKESATFIIYVPGGAVDASGNGDMQVLVAGNIQIPDAGLQWDDVYDPATGAKVILSNVGNVHTAFGPGVFRVAKEATTPSTAIAVSRSRLP